MKRLTLIAAFFIVLAVAAWYMFRGEETVMAYRFVEVERGDLESTVSATGNLSAVRTVEVGTQVSGQVAELRVDFNDAVSKGQLIARIDPTLLNLAVQDAQASLERAEAELLRAQREYDRKKTLFESKVLTEEEWNTAEYTLALAKASLASSKVDLQRAERNLAYTQIYSPVNGVVIERNADVGQTVAASFSAPVLFLIAEDLSKMEIQVSVDESDIGMIQEGQQTRFTVQAYPDDFFEGTVRQVRMQSVNQENVVNYTVVVDVQNDDGRLLPGMTATVDFLIETATNVLKVANAGLRFTPSEELMAAFQEKMQARRDSMQAAGGGAPQGEAASGGPRGGWQAGGGAPGAGGPMALARQGGPGGMRGADMARLWVLDQNGELGMIRVRTGISDGQSTEIMGEDIEVGMQVIAGVTMVEAGSEGPTNPFQNNGQRGFRPGAF